MASSSASSFAPLAAAFAWRSDADSMSSGSESRNAEIESSSSDLSFFGAGFFSSSSASCCEACSKLSARRCAAAPAPSFTRSGRRPSGGVGSLTFLIIELIMPMSSCPCDWPHMHASAASSREARAMAAAFYGADALRPNKQTPLNDVEWGIPRRHRTWFV